MTSRLRSFASAGCFAGAVSKCNGGRIYHFKQTGMAAVVVIRAEMRNEDDCVVILSMKVRTVYM